MKRYYVYIIKNSDDIYYKGYTQTPLKRLEEHNSGKSFYTKNKGPWQLIFLISFKLKSEALAFEKMLKRQHHKYLNWLINSERNELNL
jgi:putative endonuclease